MMRARVSAETLAPGVKQRETAARETPASSATSFALTAFLDIIPPAIAFCTALQR